ARDGTAGGPPGRAGRGPRLCPAVFDRWLSGVLDGVGDPLWALGPAATAPGHRACAEAALDATAAAPLCPGRQDGPAPAPGAGAAPRGVWDPGDRQCGVGSPGLPDPDRLRRAAQPRPPPACGGGWTAGQHTLQTRSRPPPPTALLSRLSPLFSAP